MPYDISIPKNLHCVPLKFFDYLEFGLPIASVPLVYVRDYPDLVYTGGTAGELAMAVQKALASMSSPDVTVEVVMSEPAVLVCNGRPIADDTVYRKLGAYAEKQQKSKVHDQGSSMGVGRARM